jgi:adenylate cyclase
MSRHQLVRAVWGGLIVAMALGAMATIGLGIGLARGARASAVDGLFPDGRADDRVVIVTADRDLMRRARIDPVAGYGSLLSETAQAGPATVVVERDLVTTAEAQIATLRPADEPLVVEAAFERLGVALFPAAPGQLEEPRSGSRLPTQTRPILAEEGVNAAAGTGVDVTAGSPQAIVRTLPLAVEIVGAERERRGTVVPSLALLALSRADGLQSDVQERSRGLEIGGRFIPTEGDQELRIRYVDDLLPGGDQVITASQLIGGDVPSDELRGRTVVLGVTDSSTVAPLPAPAGPGRLAPVFVQANAINTLLTEEYLVPDSSIVTVAAAAGLAFVVAFAVLLVPLWVTPVPAVIAGAAWWLFAASRFRDGHVTDIVYPLTAVALALVGAGGWRAWREFQERRRVSALFARYVPDAVVDELLEAGKAEAAAAGRRLDVAVMFCDLRGFTRMSEQLEATQVREILEVYFEEASRVILDHDGTVLQFVGDEVLAVFGAPLPQADHAAAALACARDMLDVRPELNAKLADRDLPPVEYGIGLHAGDIVAAHIGSSAHTQYGIVGDTANVGSRLCAQARSGEIVVSEETLQAAGGDHNAERIGPLELKGIERQLVGYRITTNSLRAE